MNDSEVRTVVAGNPAKFINKRALDVSSNMVEI